MYLCIYVYMHICIYVFMYMYMYICTDFWCGPFATQLCARSLRWMQSMPSVPRPCGAWWRRGELESEREEMPDKIELFMGKSLENEGFHGKSDRKVWDDAGTYGINE